jgi:secreted trypsin-like serine protease
VGGDASATGGTCFGDSGGPIFLADTNVVAAVSSFGLNGNCAGSGGGYRVDAADDLDWLATFLP